MESTPTTERQRKNRLLFYSSTRWRTEAEQRIYSSKLLGALRQVRRRTSSSPSARRGFREAADRALAFAARGRSRWSRAILRSNRRKPKPKPSSRRSRAKKAPWSMLPVAPGGNNVLERKARVLGRLVPGCRMLSFPCLLDETWDYISALQMQVRAMTVLSEILSSSSSSSL